VGTHRSLIFKWFFQHEGGNLQASLPPLIYRLRASTNDKSKKTQPKIKTTQRTHKEPTKNPPKKPPPPPPTSPAVRFPPRSHDHVVATSASNYAQLKGSISFPTVPDGTRRTGAPTTHQAGPGLLGPNCLAYRCVSHNLLHR
jgi:hypothetical protein